MLYEVECKTCRRCYEVTMSLETKKRFDTGKVYKKCPECGRKLSPVISLVRLSSERACFGY